jgi:hypothetical protein
MNDMQLDQRRVRRHLRPARVATSVGVIAGGIVLFLAAFMVNDRPAIHRHWRYQSAPFNHGGWYVESCSDRRCSTMDATQCCACGRAHCRS